MKRLICLFKGHDKITGHFEVGNFIYHYKCQRCNALFGLPSIKNIKYNHIGIPSKTIEGKEKTSQNVVNSERHINSFKHKLHSKQGLIKISNELLENDWGRIYIFMEHFRPIHIEFRNFENNTWYMWGVSDFFDELNECEATPQYDVIFTKYENGNISYQFKRVSN